MRYWPLMVLVAGTGCATVRMDEKAAEARVRARYGPEAAGRWRIQPVTSKLVAELTALRSWTRGNPGPDPLAEQARAWVYRVAPFDILTVTVYDHPELTNPAGEYRTPDASGLLVTASGEIFYPYVGSVEVAGKTVAEIRTLLARRLAPYIKNVQVDVRVAAFRGRKVQVAGQVLAPQTLPVTDVPMRVQDAIAQARGLTPDADLQHVTLTRGGQVHVLNMLAVYEAGDRSQNWLLDDGDFLYVPDRRQTNIVVVMGEVRAPAIRVMNNGRMTLAEALGENGGLDPVAADASLIYVIRGNYEVPEIYRLDASSADAFLLAVQFPLLPRDVVFVSTRDVASWNRVMSQILPTIQGIWQLFDIYRISGAPLPVR